MMKITFWGGAQTVTGSMHLISTPTETHLVECGLFQGHRREALERNSDLPFAPTSVDSMILSHAHLDHSGSIPTLVRRGFNGYIHATPATIDLCRYMLADSAHLQEKDFAFMAKRNARRKAIRLGEQHEPVEPLYTTADVETALTHFAPCPLHKAQAAGRELEFEFGNAGHILGSAFVLLRVGEAGHRVRVLFSGDLGRPGLPILRDPDPAPEADYLILESTYGNRMHRPIAEVRDRLLALVSRTIERGGHVIVPAFAVGRTQELIVLLHELVEEKRLPDVPIFVDSPLAISVTDVFRRYSEEFDSEAAKFVKHGGDAFGFHRLRYLRDASESKALNDVRFPYVVISASGMCEGGRVLHHLRNGIEDTRNLILITGFQVANTLGRRLVDGHSEVKIFGESMRVRAEVAVLNELSAHADRKGLLEWVRPIAPKLKRVLLVHGEPDAQKTLADALLSNFNLEVICPERGDSVDLA